MCRDTHGDNEHEIKPVPLWKPERASQELEAEIWCEMKKAKQETRHAEQDTEAGGSDEGRGSR